MWCVLYINKCMIVWRFHHIRPFASPPACLPACFLISLSLLNPQSRDSFIASYTLPFFPFHRSQVLYSVSRSLFRSARMCVLFPFLFISLSIWSLQNGKKYEVKISKLKNSIKCTNTQTNERLCFSHFCSRFKYSSRPSFFPLPIVLLCLDSFLSCVLLCVRLSLCLSASVFLCVRV